MNYLLRDIPPELWKKARVKSVKEGRSLREILIELLREWVKGGAR